MGRVFVYFVGSKGGPIKIGKARNVKSRLAGLNTSSPEPLDLLGVMFGVDQLEKALHARFAHLRMHGEWFRRDQELLEFIDRNTFSSDVAYFKRIDPEGGLSREKEELRLREQQFKIRTRQRSTERDVAARKEVIDRMGAILVESIVCTWSDQLYKIRATLAATRRALREADLIVVKEELRDAVRDLLGCQWRLAERFLFDRSWYESKDAEKTLTRMAEAWLLEKRDLLYSEAGPFIQIESLSDSEGGGDSFVTRVKANRERFFPAVKTSKREA